MTAQLHREFGRPWSAGDPIASIGIPVFNGEAFLATAIESALSQNFEDYEIIISDNCSVDSTEQICRAYAHAHTRISYQRQNENIGGQGNFNYLAARARGRFITWLAHDDVLEPDFLRRTVEYLLDHPLAVASTGDILWIDAKGNEIRTDLLVSIRHGIPWSRRRLEFFKYPMSNAFFCVYALMRTDVGRKVTFGLREPKVASGSELPFLSRLALEGEIASLPCVLRRYREHGSSGFKAEQARLAKRSRIRRALFLWKHINHLRLGQAQVLIAADLPVVVKVHAFASLFLFYLRLIAGRVYRVVARLLLRASGRAR